MNMKGYTDTPLPYTGGCTTHPPSMRAIHVTLVSVILKSYNVTVTISDILTLVSSDVDSAFPAVLYQTT